MSGRQLTAAPTSAYSQSCPYPAAAASSHEQMPGAAPACLAPSVRSASQSFGSPPPTIVEGRDRSAQGTHSSSAGWFCTVFGSHGLTRFAGTSPPCATRWCRRSASSNVPIVSGHAGAAGVGGAGGAGGDCHGEAGSDGALCGTFERDHAWSEEGEALDSGHATSPPSAGVNAVGDQATSSHALRCRGEDWFECIQTKLQSETPASLRWLRHLFLV